MRPSYLLVANTLSQYGRTIVNVLCSLFATRLVLQALGDNDFGIYSLVAGIVSMLSFLTNALTTTTQRYLSFNFREDSLTTRRGYYINSLFIHFIFGLITVVLLLGALYFLFNGFLNIEQQNIHASKIVYVSMVIMLFIALMTSPYRSVLLSHENIIYLSIVDICDGLLKLLIAVLIFSFENDRLIWYAYLMTGISLFNIIAIGLYATIKYNECKELRLSYFSKAKMKELSSFAGWTIYGTLCLFGRVQGIAIILNKFLNTAVNAAYGISIQVNAALNSISSALQTSLAPQLIKAEGNGNRELMFRLSEFGCKAGYILMSMVAFPIIFDINGILQFWLGEYPPYTAYFCVILIVSNLFDQMTGGLGTVLNAVGNIRNYTITINTLKLMTTFIIAVLLYFGVSLYIAFSTYVLIEIFGCIIRIGFCHINAELSIYSYITNVVLKLLFPTIIVIVIYLCLSNIEFSLVKLICKFISASSIYAICLFKYSLTEKERNIVSSIYYRLIKNRF